MARHFIYPFLMVLLACGMLSNPTPPADGKTDKLTVRIDTILSDLRIPWAMAFLPNGDMLFTEREGELRLYSEGKLHPDPIADVPKVVARGQGGLLDLELHPDFGENGWIYLSYSAPLANGESGRGSNTALMRARIRNHRLVDQEVLFKASPNYGTAHHYGGRIEFDREGFVYLSVGDRGGRDEVQTLSTMRGKIFRLHDDGRIPESNPFTQPGGKVSPIFSWGHRNPQGLALHPQSGELWEHEHGPRGGDEVNIVRKGKNYGWPAITFGINYSGSIITKDTAKAGMEQPVTYYVPSIAPCGMDFVESDLYGPWKGNLLIGSLKFRYVKRLELDGNQVREQETILEGLGRIRCIRQAPDGYLYIATEGPGLIVRLVPE